MDESSLREQLVELLDGVGAHMPFEEAVAGFPDDAINRRAPNVAYTPWHLVEHLRLTQRDFVEYVTNRDYVEPHWPDDYWPSLDAETTPGGFARSVRGFLDDRATLRALVLDPATDLFAVIPNTPGHTILRAIRLDADHNAYHVGEFAVLRQVMGTWPADRRE